MKSAMSSFFKILIRDYDGDQKKRTAEAALFRNYLSSIIFFTDTN
jgi:hypothetical protein